MFFEKYFLTHLEEAIQRACAATWGTRMDKYQVQSVTQINMDGEETYLIVMHDRKTVAPITAYIIQTDEFDADVMHQDAGLKGAPDSLSPEINVQGGLSGEGLYIMIDQNYGYFINEEALMAVRPFLVEEPND